MQNVLASSVERNAQALGVHQAQCIDDVLWELFDRVDGLSLDDQPFALRRGGPCIAAEVIGSVPGARPIPRSMRSP